MSAKPNPVEGDTALRAWAAGWTEATATNYGYARPVFVYTFRATPVDEDYPDPLTIYVGITNNLLARIRAHSRKWWWPAVDLDHSEADAFPTRAKALAAEARDIAEYNPPMNVAGRSLAVVTPLLAPVVA